MGHNNYSRFSKPFGNNNGSHEHTAEVTEEVVEEVTENVEEVVPEVVNTIGVVDCEKLNVRKEPNKDAEVACVIEKSSEVQITMEDSTEDFYSVVTASGIAGYCMKKFITIK